MCGLTGIIVDRKNGFTDPERQQLASLMLLTQFRGSDSTGVCSVSNKLEYSMLKSVGNPNILWGTKNWEEWYTDIYNRGKLVFAHGRAATRGTVTEENAHPFIVEKPNKEGSIVFVHNGTLDTEQQLPGLKTFQVDSHWLAHSIAERGAQETFSKVSGPIACMYWDSELKTFNIYRNNGRPLYIAQDTVTKNVYINSEIETLMYLKYRFGLQYDNLDVKTLASEHLYILDLKEQEKGFAKQEIKYVRAIIDDPWNYHGHSVGPSKWNDHRAARNLLVTGATRTQTPSGHNNYYLDRGLEQDIAHLISGEFIEVEWDPRGASNFMFDRLTTNRGNITFTSCWCEPYIKNLVRLTMETDKDGVRWIIKEFYDPEHVRTWMERSLVLPDNDTPEEPDSKNPSVTGLKKGMKSQWKSKTRTRGKVQHKATVSAQKVDMLTEYWNTIDGEYKVGEVLNLEPYEYRQKTKGMCEVRFMKVQVEPNVCVDIFGHTRELKDEAEKWDYYTGKILNMRVVSAEEHNKYGYFVHIAVTELVGHMFASLETNIREINPRPNQAKLLN